MDDKLKQWREDGKYLPEFLKDFHDQKDFFRMLHEKLKVEDHEMLKDVNWIQSHIYTVDFFLWYCAKFGYTLQKSRAKQNFDDIGVAISQVNEIRQDMFRKALLSGLEKAEKEDKKNKE